MKDLVRCRIGTINEENNLMFEGEYEVSRLVATPQITFLGKPYMIVNTEHNCYIPLTDYKRLFA